jgi:uncharacterized LabA/DUF88 family protein
MKKVAVVIDGGFVKKLFKKQFRRNDVPTPKQIIGLGKNVVSKDEELFRIYYYDCLPFEKELKKPVSGGIFKDDAFINAGKRYISEIAHSDMVAYRSGELKFGGWNIKPKNLEDILKSGRKVVDEDFAPVFKQKKVDIKIGLDIAWLSIRKIVDRIILIGGDSDFIPAMKLARIEGIQIILVHLRNPISADMREHSDEVRDFDTTSIKP